MKLPILNIICEYFSPLVLAVEDRYQLQALLEDMGWSVTLTDEQVSVINTILSVVDSADELLLIVDEVENESISAGAATEQVILIGQALYATIDSLSSISVSQVASLPSPLNEDGWWQEFALAMPGYLLLRWLRINPAYIYEILHFSGIISETQNEEGSQILREIHWDKFGQFLSNPSQHIVDHYQWGSQFDHSSFIPNLRRLITSFSLPAKTIPLSESVTNTFFSDISPVSGASELEIILAPKPPDNTELFFEPRLRLAPVPSATDSNDFGLYLYAQLFGTPPASQPINESWQFDYSDLTHAIEQGIGIEIQSDGFNFAASLPRAEAALRILGEPEGGWTLFGNPDGARLALSRLESSLSIRDTGSMPELVLSVSSSGGDEQGLKLVINPAEGDSFISEVMGVDELAIGADIGFTWSSQSGFRFDGGAGFEVTIPLNLNLGSIRVDLLRLAIQGGTDGAQVEVAVTGAVDISVITVVADDIGVRANLVPLSEGDTSGLLGSLDLQFAFKPPIGLGLVIDGAGIVSGGGYIEHDEDKGQYAGVAQIGFLTLDLSAIGVLNTIMPDGTDGWSLFLSVFSEFPPLQLGFGFTLNGVGGLVGINRTLDDEALRERLLQGALDSIMFPDDPVANAPIIINDIEAVFPPAQGQFIFGAMLKVGWGTPSLLTVDLGVMVELPDPVRIALLGQLESILPTREIRILELHMDVFGLADLTAQTFSLDAVLRDSHIVGLLTLSGDMSMRSDLLDQPTMLLSIGGFHPDFKAPAEFPTKRRMQASIPVGPAAKVELACYVAFTSNTFQMGGRLDVWAKFSGFTAEGFIEADALIQYVPFGFAIHIGFGATVKAGSITLMGVDVNGNLLGPSPWEVFGTATFEILGFEKDIDLEISVGKDKDTIAERYDIAELLVEALSRAENWSVPEDGDLSNSARLREPGADEIPGVHPAGQVQVIQKLVPLGVDIETFGGAEVKGQDNFSVNKVRVGADWRAIDDDEFIQDWFAPAQFFKMSDDEKVKAPSFEMMDGGVRFGSVTVEAGNEAELDVEYEEIFIDPGLNQRRMSKIPQSSLSAEHLSKVTGLAATEKHRQQNARFNTQTIEPKYQVSPQRYVGMNAETGDLASAIGLQQGKTYAEVASKAKKNKAASILGTGNFEVVPREEMLIR